MKKAEPRIRLKFFRRGAIRSGLVARIRLIGYNEQTSIRRKGIIGLLIYVMLALMIISAGIIAYRAIRLGAEYHLVENAAMAIVVSAAASILAEPGSWFSVVRYVYVALGAAYIAYGAYGKYKGGTDGYGQ